MKTLLIFSTFYHKYDGNVNVSGRIAGTPASMCWIQGTVIQTSLICSEFLRLRGGKQSLCHFYTQLTETSEMQAFFCFHLKKRLTDAFIQYLWPFFYYYFLSLQFTHQVLEKVLGLEY